MQLRNANPANLVRLVVFFFLILFLVAPTRLDACQRQDPVSDPVESGLESELTIQDDQQPVPDSIELEPVPAPSESIVINDPTAVQKHVPKEVPVLSPEEIDRKSVLERCLAVYYTRQVDADVLRPWSIMHGLIGYGEETLIISKGRRYSATEYLCTNGIGDDRRILHVNNGQLVAKMGPGVQGHEAQLLAMLAQAEVPQDRPLNVDGQKFTVRDLVELEMSNCRSDSELTFKLLSLSHYLDSDTTWTNNRGEPWSISRLLSEELAQPVNDGACGGTHRLMAISYALKQRRAEGKPVDGHWYRAEDFIGKFQEYAWSFQHRDGSFSTAWFKDKEFSGDVQKKLYATGHILEWMVFSLPDDELKDPRVTRSVDFILNLMMSAPNYDLAVGPRGHALHALRIYQEKVFEKTDYTRLMSNKSLVRNNPQNGGGPQQSQSESSRPLLPASCAPGIFGRRR